jgi:hypothetical protein
MEEILKFIILLLLMFLLLYILIASCWYGISIIIEHPFKGIAFICLGVSFLVTMVGVSK